MTAASRLCKVLRPTIRQRGPNFSRRSRRECSQHSTRMSPFMRRAFARRTASASSADGSSCPFIDKRSAWTHLKASEGMAKHDLVLQEALADSFEVMTLYEDALIQYDELEAAFFQVSKGAWLAFAHVGRT